MRAQNLPQDRECDSDFLRAGEEQLLRDELGEDRSRRPDVHGRAVRRVPE